MSGIRVRQRLEKPAVVLLGNFDGVHLGHQAMIQRGKEIAQAQDLRLAVLSFEPHPLKVLAPEKAPKLLRTGTEKLQLLEHFGVDDYLPVTFDIPFSKLSPRAFVERLVDRVALRHLLVGYNFRFGYQRTGDGDTLRKLGRELDFELVQIPCREMDGESVSSSRVRLAVREGDMLLAQRLLNRPYFLQGVVGAGDQIGRELQARTANIHVDNELVPRHGVYATWAYFDGQWHRAVTNVGTTPTFNRQTLRVETHILDWSGDLYERHLWVSFGSFLRPERKFSGPAALQAQIQDDLSKRIALSDQDPPSFYLHPLAD